MKLCSLDASSCPAPRQIPSRRNLLPIVRAGEWVKSTHRTRTIGMCSFDVRTKFNSPTRWNLLLVRPSEDKLKNASDAAEQEKLLIYVAGQLRKERFL